MDDLQKMKIAKKSYHFDVRRKFESSNHYKVVQKSPIEKIRMALNSSLKPKTPPKSSLAQKSQKAVPSGGFDLKMVGLAVFVALLILVGGILYVQGQITQILSTPVQNFATPQFSSNLADHQLLSYGQRGSTDHVFLLNLDKEAANLDNLTIQISTYEKRIPSEVFVLSSERTDAQTYSDFISSLKENLGSKNIPVNEISLSELQSLTSPAFVIIPSGAIPKELLGIDSNTNIAKLTQRGFVFIFIGQPFTKYLDGTVKTTPSNVLDSLPFVFNERSITPSTSDISLFQPLYKVTTRSQGWFASEVFGSLSVAQYEDGAIIFVPQTLDKGWQNRDFRSAAKDISSIITKVPWLTPNSENKTYSFNSSILGSGSLTIYSNPFPDSFGTARISMIGSLSGIAKKPEQLFYSYLNSSPKGELFIDEGSTVVPSSITGKSIRLNSILTSPNPLKVPMNLNFYNSKGDLTLSLSQGEVDVQSETSFDIRLDVPKDEYLVTLVDDFGTVYAQSYLKVVTLEVTPFGNNREKNSVYLFKAFRESTPVPVQDLTVSVDNGKYGTYNIASVDADSFISVDVSSKTGGDFLPYGTHTFKFTSPTGLDVTVPIERREAQTIFKDPIFWVTMLLAGGIVLIGVFFARPEIPTLTLDIPDFPPIERSKVFLNVDAVLNIFDRVNSNYRWQNTPLTLSEIKNGFKDVYYSGKPVIISDYNLESLLAQLKSKSFVGEYAGYYGLLSWEAKTKHSFEYLATFRKVRDWCINNALPFTAIGESKEADTVLSILGQPFFLHFYNLKESSLDNLLSRVLKTSSKGVSIVLFKSDLEKRLFSNNLYWGSSLPLKVKLEVEGNSIFLLTFEEFEKKIVEFKGF